MSRSLFVSALNYIFSDFTFEKWNVTTGMLKRVKGLFETTRIEFLANPLSDTSLFENNIILFIIGPN